MVQFVDMWKPSGAHFVVPVKDVAGCKAKGWTTTKPAAPKKEKVESVKSVKSDKKSSYNSSSKE